MRSLFFDTETTGLWDFKADAYAMNQPGLCQLGALLFDDRRLVGELNLIVQPLNARGERMRISDETAAIHGVTNDLVDRVGVSYKIALPMFNNLLRIADRVVAFNTDYDRRVMRCAYNRVAADQDLLVKADWRCAMMSAAEPVGLPGRYGDKFGWPKLIQAYKALVDEAGFDGQHDAMEDVRATAKVTWAVEDKGLPLLKPKGDK